MTYREKRRATADEITLACFIRHVDQSRVAEAWVDELGACELVLVGFVDKVKVSLQETA